MNIDNYFKKEQLISNLSKYETYFHITFGTLTHKFNTEAKIIDLELQYILGSIYEMIKELEASNEEFNFEEELKKQACIDSLQEYINTNLELVKNEQIHIEEVVNQINDNVYFDETLTKLFEENLEIEIKKYSEIITNEVVEAINTSLKQLEEK